jgi:uncharacterized protein YndB with AHSA1/START domain
LSVTDYLAFTAAVARARFFCGPRTLHASLALPPERSRIVHQQGESRMLAKIALAVVAIVVVILGMAAMKPDNFSVRRVASIKAPPEKIAALVTDFHQWTSWSPWERLDPNMKRTFNGAPAGKGAIYEWVGNRDVGQGRMEILDASSPAKTVIKLDFLKPFESHNTTEFTLLPQGDMTEVSWHMTGPMPFMSKIVSVFMSMDAIVGKDFDKGLANMKAAAEK